MTLVKAVPLALVAYVSPSYGRLQHKRDSDCSS